MNRTRRHIILGSLLSLGRRRRHNIGQTERSSKLLDSSTTTLGERRYSASDIIKRLSCRKVRQFSTPASARSLLLGQPASQVFKRLVDGSSRYSVKRRCLSDPRSRTVEPASQRNGRKLGAHLKNTPERHRTSTKVLRRLGILRSRTSNHEPRLSVPHCKTVDIPEQGRTAIGSKTVDTPEL